MAEEKSPRTKSETLSLRLDPKTRFVLEFLARINRQSITTVVEEAVRTAGSERKVESSSSGRGPSTWIDYWDINEGVRTINILADRAIPSSYKDDELREFIQSHIEFFSETCELTNPNRVNVAILWPKIDDYLEIWRQSKRGDPWKVGVIMSEHLSRSSVDAPEWPRRRGPRALESEIGQPVLDASELAKREVERGLASPPEHLSRSSVNIPEWPRRRGSRALEREISQPVLDTAELVKREVERGLASPPWLSTTAFDVHRIDVRTEKRITDLVASEAQTILKSGVTVALQYVFTGWAIELRREEALDQPDLAEMLLEMDESMFVSRGGEPMAAGAIIIDSKRDDFLQELRRSFSKFSVDAQHDSPAPVSQRQRSWGKNLISAIRARQKDS